MASPAEVGTTRSSLAPRYRIGALIRLSADAASTERRAFKRDRSAWAETAASASPRAARSCGVSNRPMSMAAATPVGTHLTGASAARLLNFEKEGYGLRTNVQQRMRPATLPACFSASEIAIGPEKDSPARSAGPRSADRLPPRAQARNIPPVLPIDTARPRLEACQPAHPRVDRTVSLCRPCQATTPRWSSREYRA